MREMQTDNLQKAKTSHIKFKMSTGGKTKRCLCLRCFCVVLEIL